MSDTSPDQVVPLYLYPYPQSDENMSLIRRAKAKLNLPFKVIPRGAKIGTSGRVLAIGGEPDYLTDYAPVRDPSNEQALMDALEWAVTDKVDSRATTVLKMLQRLIPGVKEIPAEQLAFENISTTMKLGQRVVSFDD